MDPMVDKIEPNFRSSGVFQRRKGKDEFKHETGLSRHVFRHILTLLPQVADTCSSSRFKVQL